MLEFLVEPKNFTTIHPNEYYSYFLKYIRKQFMGCFGTTKHMKSLLTEKLLQMLQNAIIYI